MMTPADFHRNKHLLRTRYDAGELEEAEFELRLSGLRHAYRLEARERHLARLRVKAARTSGRLVQPPACQVCGGQTVVLHAHHADHAQPYAVQWVCVADHRALSAQERA